VGHTQASDGNPLRAFLARELPAGEPFSGVAGELLEAEGGDRIEPRGAQRRVQPEADPHGRGDRERDERRGDRDHGGPAREEMDEFKSGLYYLAKKRPDLELVPVYLEYTKVVRALEQVRDEHSAMDKTSPQMIRNSLERRWDVEDISRIGWKEVDIRKVTDGYEVEAAYDAEEPFAANLYLLVKFDKLVTIQQ
jgi:hypothetical protein